MSLECNVAIQDNYYLISVQGEMTAAHCSYILDTVHECIASVDRTVIMTLEQVDYVDKPWTWCPGKFVYPCEKSGTSILCYICSS